MAFQRRRLLEKLAAAEANSTKSLIQGIIASLAFATTLNMFSATETISSDRYRPIAQALLFVAGAMTSLFVYTTERSMAQKNRASFHGSDQSSDARSLIESLYKSSSTSGTNGVIIYEPHSFDEVPRIVNSLGNGKAVIVNLSMMEADQAQRAVDFIAGSTFGFNGHQERVGESIFFFAPSNMEVSIVGSEQDNMSDSALKPKPLAEGQGEKLGLSTSTPSAETVDDNDISQSLEEEMIESASEANAVLPKDEVH